MVTLKSLLALDNSGRSTVEELPFLKILNSLGQSYDLILQLLFIYFSLSLSVPETIIDSEVCRRQRFHKIFYFRVPIVVKSAAT